MAERIVRPTEPYPTRSALLTEHMREHGYSVVLVVEEDEEDE